MKSEKELHILSENYFLNYRSLSAQRNKYLNITNNKNCLKYILQPNYLKFTLRLNLYQNLKNCDNN
jgi:hypothetical protein